MRRLVWLLLVACWAACPSWAEDAPQARLTPEQAADAVLAAVASKDDAALKALAEKDDPDPWLVADELIRRAAHDAAEGFARAAPRVDVEALPAYVASRRGAADDPARRERIAAANAALLSNRAADALIALGPAEAAPLADVVGVRLATGRGLALAALARYEESHAAHLAAAEAAERVGWLARAHQAFYQAGSSAHRGSALRLAGAAWERCLLLCERRGDEAGAAEVLGNLGSVHVVLGDSARALPFYERALAAMGALGNEAGAALTLGNIGLVHSSLGDYAKALSFHERALDAKEALGDRAGAALTLISIGQVHHSLGDYAKALSIYERALAAFEAVGHEAGAASALGSIGSVHQSFGDYAKALSFHQRALSAKEALGDKAGAASTLGSIGLVHQFLGDYARALSLFERALAALKALGKESGAAAMLASIGNVYASLGDHAKAISSHMEALATMERLGNRVGAAFALNNIAGVHRLRGDYAKALSFLERALLAHEALGNKAGMAVALLNIGVVHGSLGNSAKALSFYERALAAIESLGDKENAAKTRLNIGLVHSRLGDRAAARAAIERSVREADNLRARPILVAGLVALARHHLTGGESALALGRAREGLREVEGLLGGLSEEEGANARAKQSSLFEVGAVAAAREGDLAELLSFLECGRAGALLDALDKREVLRWKAQSLPEDLRAADHEAAAAERRARQDYEHALKGDDRRAITEAARKLDEALEGVRSVTARIERATKQAAGLFYPRARTIEDVRGTLRPNEALVLYGLCLDEALALVLRPDGERLVGLGRRSELEAACAALDASDVESDPSAALAELRRRIVEPLGLGEDVKRVILSPDGAMGLLPFGALFELPVALTPSGTTHALLLDEERTPGEGVLALGDPDYAGVSEGAREIYFRGKRLSPLPGSREEVERLGTVRLLGAKANEGAFREALDEKKRWRAVHFACHGLIDPKRPMLSSLALSAAGEDDGFLTAREILRTKIPADLAVLSACETGRGEVVRSEGIMGLTRAFMFAGAPRVLCSLWKVDDDATRALMIRFHELWNPREGAGLPAAEALQKAQAFVREHPQWKHPHYWAAWVLWGLPE